MKPTDEILLPCPFCGNSDDFEGSPWPSGGIGIPGSWVVRCGNPGCNADIRAGTPQEAIGMWNRRTPILNESPWQGDGWKLVPVEPTLEMLAAAQGTNGIKQLPRFSVLRTRYAAMISAAHSILPPPTQGSVR